MTLTAAWQLRADALAVCVRLETAISAAPHIFPSTDISAAGSLLQAAVLDLVAHPLPSAGAARAQALHATICGEGLVPILTLPSAI